MSPKGHELRYGKEELSLVWKGGEGAKSWEEQEKVTITIKSKRSDQKKIT